MASSSGPSPHAPGLPASRCASIGCGCARRGFRPIQIWVPDVRSPAFRKEAHGQSAAIAASDHARDDQAFIDAATDGGYD